MRCTDMLAAQTGKVNRSLDAMEAEAVAGINTVDIGTIAFACALGYLDLRLTELGWRDGRPQLTAWYEAFAQRKSMADTWVDPSVDPLKLSGSGAFAPANSGDKHCPVHVVSRCGGSHAEQGV